jgi:hypothetical protein
LKTLPQIKLGNLEIIIKTLPVLELEREHRYISLWEFDRIFLWEFAEKKNEEKQKVI